MRLLPKHVGRLVEIVTLSDFGGEYEPTPYGICDIPNWSDYIDSHSWSRDEKTTYDLGPCYGTIVGTGLDLEKKIFLRYARVLIAKQESNPESFIYTVSVPAGIYWIHEDFLALIDEDSP